MTSITTIVLLFISVIAVIGSAFGGYEIGKLREAMKWKRLRQMAIPGQRIWTAGVGEVFILGYSDDEEFIDFIPESFLAGRWPSEMDPDLLDKNTVSVKVNEFIANIVPQSIKQAARLE